MFEAVTTKYRRYSSGFMGKALKRCKTKDNALEEPALPFVEGIMSKSGY